jgi:hypothetical protein
MKYGAFDMVPKANDKSCNANSRHPHDTKKLANVEITNEENAHHFLQYQGHLSL